MIALIIAGGKLLEPKVLLKKIEKNDYDIVICADSGYNHAKKLDIKPDIIIGDMDSVNSNDFSCEFIKLNTEKDETDLRECVLYAFEKGFKAIDIICATGGRLDHFLSNLSILEFSHKMNINTRIIDENNVITILGSKKKFENISQYVSIIPITEFVVCSGKNLKYKMENLTVKRDNLITISNESVEKTFEIDIKEGLSYIIQSDN